MRITGGFLGGRKIKGKFPDSVRPTTDMSRETLFNILSNSTDLDNKKVLDLFAGTGLLGIEAISRGASLASFYDKSYKNIVQLKENLELLKINDKATAQKADFKTALKKNIELSDSFDIIFADPPYDQNFYEKIVALSSSNGILKPNGYLILESRSEKLINSSGFELIKERKVGSSKFTILQKV